MMANSTGWEMLSPCQFEASWSGDPANDAIEIRFGNGNSGEISYRFAVSHFGHGILTIRPGYLVRTDPGIALWVKGAPNFFLDGIIPLEGLVETDWLPYTFTMNWKFTRPGTVRFAKGDPLAFIFPIAHLGLDEIQPQVLALDQDPELKAMYLRWESERAGFLDGIKRNDERVLKQKWQRNYLVGKDFDGSSAPVTHKTKRRLKPVIQGGSES
jgi:hypothetical protein